MKVIIFWFVMTVVILIGHAQIGGHIDSLMQGPAALIVFGPVLSFLTFVYGTKGILKFGKRVLMGNLDKDDVATVERATAMAFLLGFVGALIGLVHVMEHLTDTNQIGTGIASLVVSLLYGGLPGLFLLPLCSGGIKKSSVLPSAGYAVAASLLLLFSFYSILFHATPH